MSTSNNFTKGMNQDVHPKYQEEGTYRFALNAVLETSDGEFPGISNELGNAICATDFPTQKKLIGHVQADNEDIILFLYDASALSPEHEIGIFTPSRCAYETVAKGRCLNFSDRYPINALFKIRNGCERVVYFTDAYNKYRVFNLTDTSFTLHPSTKDIISCERLNYTREYRIPCITTRAQTNNSGVLDSNGALEVGTYAFAFRYLDKELNPTDWIWQTRPVAIGDEPYKLLGATNSTSFYDGGSNNSASSFYAPKTNKSISLSLTGLDLDYMYYQIGVIKRTSDDGSLSGVDILTPTPITAATDNTFVYTGLDSQVYLTTTIDEIFAERQRLDKVVAHAQNDQRLYIGNVENVSRDYSAYQRAASATKTEWVKSNLGVGAFKTDVKKGEYYLKDATFMDSEVYALAVVFIHSDGTKSPAFHIPGRPADTDIDGYNPYLNNDYLGVASDGLAWDTGNLGTVGAISMGTFFNTSKKLRWQNMSTATAYNSTQLSGLMGYYEATTKYPTIASCDNHADGYWGRDWQGNLIVPGTTKIRHHKMPGPEMNKNNQAHRTGISFTNLIYPNSDVVGHIFLYGSRERERTVLYRGSLTPLYNGNDDTMEYDVNRTLRYTEGWGIANSPTYQKTYAFSTPEHQFNNTYKDGVYFKLDYINGAQVSPQNIDVASDALSNAYHIDQYDTDVDTFTTAIFLGDGVYSSLNKLNYRVDFSAYLPKAYPGQQTGNVVYNPAISKSIINNSINTNIQVLTLDSELQELQTGDWDKDAPTFAIAVPGGALMADVDVYNNLFAIEYLPANNCVLAQPEVQGAGKYITYAGDTFLTRFNTVEFEYSQSNDEGKDITATFTSVLYPDSDYNSEFRHGSKQEKKYSYWQTSYTRDHEAARNYIGSKYYEESDDIMLIYPESYNYNKSYSYINSLAVFRPIAFNHEMCNACLEKFPFRIYYSQNDNQETSEDRYRIIYVNNYRDLEGAKGEITDLFINFEQLYATTPTTVYHIPTRPQVIKTEGVNTYLGTGEALSIPPVQLKSTEYSFGGQEHFKSRVGTEYGTFYIDSISGRPILLTNQLEDISMDGMRNFWQNNGKLFLREQFSQLIGVDYPVIATTNKAATGYISTYDPRYKRLITHKRDFRILPEWASKLEYFPLATDTIVGGPVGDGRFWFNGFSFYHNIYGSSAKISPESPGFFENLSFTMSYSFLTKHWVSFHSYLPYYLFNSSSNYFSANHFDIYYSSIYKHNQPNFQTYYGDKYNHTVDFIVNNSPLDVKTTQFITYTSKTSLLDDVTEQWIDTPKTYSAATIYNTRQSSGENNITPKFDNFAEDTSGTDMFVTRVDNQWRMNNLWDLTVNNTSSIWDSSWPAKQGTPYIFTDKKPNLANINYGKSLFEQARFRDHYLGVRFHFNIPENLKITTDLVTTMNSNKNR